MANEMDLNEVELFHGPPSDSFVQIYARLPVENSSPEQRFTLSGEVTGPNCQHSKTLPVTFPLTDLGPGGTLLARAGLTDPCCWSPELPMLYRVHLELRADGNVIMASDYEIGVRNFGVREKSLYLNGQRWVPRGVTLETALEGDIEAWREASAVLVATNPNDELCRLASSQGVFIIAILVEAGERTAAELKRLARWPAVGIVVTDGAVDPALAKNVPNVIIGQMLDLDSGNAARVAGEDLVVLCSSDSDAIGARIAEFSQPVIAYRQAAVRQNVTDLRLACDHLQRDLAKYGDLAGFLV